MATALATEPRQAAMLPLPYRVVRRRRELHDTWTIELEPVADAIEPLQPGQFTMLYAFGVGEVPISSSGAPGERIVHTIRDVGAVTHALCNADLVGVRGPFGNGWPVTAAEGADVLVVAGGVGLPPLRPVLYHLLANRDAYGSVVLLYGGRTPADLVYRKELERWRARFDLDVLVTVDSAGSDWHGPVGVVTKLIGRARFDPSSAVAYLCGPEIMMRFAGSSLIDAGVDPTSIYVSMERTMRCGVGLCGHCQLGPTLICRDGPVYRLDEIAEWMEVPEL